MNQYNTKIKIAKKRQQSFFLKVIFLIIIAFLIFAISYFFLNSKRIKFTPNVQSYYIDFVKGKGLVLFNRILFLSKSITIIVSSEGYQDFENSFLYKDINSVDIKLKIKNTNITISSNTEFGENNWFLDDKLISNNRILKLEVIPGVYKIKLKNKFYLSNSLEINLIKDTNKKNYELKLIKVIGSLNIVTIPKGANIFIKQNKIGESPLSFELTGGLYDLEIKKEGYQNTNSEIQIDNTNLIQNKTYKLKTNKIKVDLNLEPSTGDLFVNNTLTDKNKILYLHTKKKYKITYKKNGYKSQEKDFYFFNNKNKKISFLLEKEYGEINIISEPKANILINDIEYGVTPKKIKLQTLKQKILIKKDGYVTYSSDIITKPYEPSLIDIKLEKKIERLNRLSKRNYTNSIGINFKLFNPGEFVMGAPRHEKGQRANEFIKNIILRKKFYASLTEITVGQFMMYKNKNYSKKKKEFPVSNITWIEAARFCNWLSEKENLDTVYLFNSKNYIGANLQSNGYRLPTEAEWEWLARKAERNKTTKFTWGKSLPIPKMSGNLADESTIGLMELYIPNYKDSHKLLAPVASFNKDISGLFDMTGNVKEWVHDYYLVSVQKDNMVYYDPSGPERGVGHVVKGSSYLSATLQEIRASYRDSEVLRKADIGFRIVRYLYGKEFKNDKK